MKAGKTALHTAAIHGQTDVISVLLQHSVDVDDPDLVNHHHGYYYEHSYRTDV